MNLDSRGREVISTSFSSKDAAVFVVGFAGGSFAFAQSVVSWRRG
jgi:hypothetical protein